MKHFILIISLLLSGLCAQALSVNGFINKYKKLPDAQYQEFNKKDLDNQMDSVSDSEKEVLKLINKMKVLVVRLDDGQVESLTSDLNSIKNYSLTMSFVTSDGEQKKPANPMQSMFYSVFNSSIATDIYSKDSSTDQYLSDPIIVFALWDMTFIIFLEGKLKPDDAEGLVKMGVDTDTTVTITPLSE